MASQSDEVPMNKVLVVEEVVSGSSGARRETVYSTLRGGAR